MNYQTNFYTNKPIIEITHAYLLYEAILYSCGDKKSSPVYVGHVLL